MLLFVGKVYSKAEEAINFYSLVFRNAPDGAKAGETKATVLARYGKGEDPGTEGAVRYAQFSLRGQEFGAMDSARAHPFAFNEAISFLAPCESQEEIDYFWGKLSADLRAEQCGLAEGPVWPLLADRSRRDGRVPWRQGSGADRARDPGRSEDEKVRYCRARAGGRRVTIRR